ncbi:reverse transcriptase [Gossypium australe]|uniref:Reverse transcriptase n=1 Tax=Gossypium australe TaxID=47621 RepID=A0A5B6WPU5_9ROSI|nr:reverse transcriptase [Gossypium australe]
MSKVAMNVSSPLGQTVLVNQSPEGDMVEVSGIRLSTNKLLNQGCEDFLAYVINLNSDESLLSRIRTICEFPNVFPEEFSELPPDCEFEFVIEVYSSTTLVSIAPYRMASLKIQLRNLLGRVFMCPNKSPWGAPTLFFKKKDGLMWICIDYR